MKIVARVTAGLGWACLAAGLAWWLKNRDRSWPGV